jgi:hypothetical protein
MVAARAAKEIGEGVRFKKVHPHGGHRKDGGRHGRRALEALPCLNDRHLLGQGRRLSRMKGLAAGERGLHEPQSTTSCDVGPELTITASVLRFAMPSFW